MPCVLGDPDRQQRAPLRLLQGHQRGVQEGDQGHGSRRRPGLDASDQVGEAGSVAVMDAVLGPGGRRAGRDAGGRARGDRGEAGRHTEGKGAGINERHIRTGRAQAGRAARRLPGDADPAPASWAATWSPSCWARTSTTSRTRSPVSRTRSWYVDDPMFENFNSDGSTRRRSPTSSRRTSPAWCSWATPPRAWTWSARTGGRAGRSRSPRRHRRGRWKATSP